MYQPIYITMYKNSITVALSMDSQPRKDRFRAKRQPVVDIERNACAFRFPPPPLLSPHADSRASLLKDRQLHPEITFRVL